MSINAPEVTKEKLIEEFNSVVNETEQLLKSVAGAGSDKAGAIRGSVEQNLASAKDQLRQLQQTVSQKTHAAMESTDGYVRQNPWQAIGIVGGAGLVLGALIGLSLNRR
jgi:ElaB/YqjD/DUF883 family membrane-anchored ribosome-binding protein